MNFTHEYHTNRNIHCEPIIHRKSNEVWLYCILNSYGAFGYQYLSTICFIFSTNTQLIISRKQLCSQFPSLCPSLRFPRAGVGNGDTKKRGLLVQRLKVRIKIQKRIQIHIISIYCCNFFVSSRHFHLFEVLYAHNINKDVRG